MTEQNTEQATPDQDDLNENNEVRSSAQNVAPSPEADDEQDGQDEQDEPDTFPRDYVERLRDENARYRQRAQRADDLAAALWAARVAATGRLADPDDLPLPDDGDPLDGDLIEMSISDLLTAKPHLASRRPRGDVGQGMAGSTASTDLAGMLRSRA